MLSRFRTTPLVLVSMSVITVPTSALRSGARAAPLPAAAPARAAAQAAADPDLGWPRTYAITGGTVVLYQPQIASWDNQRHIVAWSAVSYAPTMATTPSLGTIKIEANTRVAVDERLVSFSDFTIAESNFSTLSRDETRNVVAGLQQAIPDGERVIALDRVLASVDKSAIRPKDVPGVKADPPKVFASTKPAVLVNLDGAPVWNPIKDVDLQVAVNTNWDLFQALPTRTFYLRDDRSWLKATDLNGPWTPAGTLPASFGKLPADDSFKDVKANVPGRAIAASAVPAVFVSTEPAELLLLKGAPAYQPIAGTSLLWVNNTDSDLFRFGRTGLFYYLVAGRWFSAPDITGPWTFATPTLPDDFKKIPLEHPRSRVLASVPGTEQANEAVLLAEVPQTARVNRKDVKAPDVVYQGNPQFEPIATTTVRRAVNTDKDILKVGDLYYLCFQAVWFMSRTPNGPWEVATSVPKEIYTIPASSPSYNVTYVTIEESQPNSDWVTFAYVAGYTGMMIAWGCAVWGTGWYYPPYVWHGPYPVYYGFPRTYGFSAWYNPYTGAFGRGTAVYGPYGGAGAAAVYNPRTGAYARGAAAYGPYGSRGVAQAWNPRTGTYAQTRQGSNIYGNWGSSSVQRGDAWARTGHVTNYRTGATTRGVQTGAGGSAVTRTGVAGRTTVARGAGGDVYAGHDGNVYRRSSDGSWQHWNNGGWNASTPAQTRGQLDRDSQARTTGAERTREVNTYRQAPTRSAAGSYRGARAGGARRR